MEQWDYIHLKLSSQQIEGALQQHGFEGWELASLVITRYQRVLAMFPEVFEATEYVAILKRRRNNPSDM
jgi:hypothetical protein